MVSIDPLKERVTKLKNPNHLMFTYLKVLISMNVRNIFDVDEKAQLISLEISYRMFWKDERVKGFPAEGQKFVNINRKGLNKFWIPDIFIDQV